MLFGGKGKAGKLLVGTPEGVWKTWRVHRKPYEGRGRKETADLVRDRDRDGEQWLAPRMAAQNALRGEQRRE